MKRSLQVLLVSLIYVLTVVPAFPQALGTPPYGSFGGGSFDVIDLGNLNVHFTIPVFQRQGRGKSFYYNISYDSTIWTPTTSGGVTSWTPAGGWGWRSQTDAATGYIPAPATLQGSCRWFDGRFWHTEYWIKSTYSGFVDPLGTFHQVRGLVLLTGAPDCTGEVDSITKTATDGSGWTVTVPTGTVTSRSGVVWNVPVGTTSGAAKITDTNGNQITTSDGKTFYDSLSSTTPVLTISGNAPSPVTYTYTSPNQTPASYTMNYLPYTVQTNFQASNSRRLLKNHCQCTAEA